MDTADLNTEMSQEESLWRDKEEKIKEATFDVEMKEKDESVRSEEVELNELRNFPLSKLVEGGITSTAKQQELAANHITTLGQLVTWLNSLT